MEVMYDEAIRASDIVIACGQALFDDAVEARGSADGVHLIENGVFFDVLRGGADKVVPRELQGLPHPIVAYVGRINKTVDLETLGNIARARPGWSVVVMGPKVGWTEKYEETFRRLLSLPNFRYVEGRPASEIGAYLNAIDVGLISYANDGIKDFRFPLKMVEYFSFGKPVVSVDLSSIQRFVPLVRMVKTEAEWVPAIEEALASDSAERRAARIDAARSMDWSEKAREILGLIDRALAQRGR
jgi:glycosyltransferase involved in cell wall biosynthesis